MKIAQYVKLYGFPISILAIIISWVNIETKQPFFSDYIAFIGGIIILFFIWSDIIGKTEVAE